MIFSSLLTFLSASTLFISSLSSLFTPTRLASRQVDETKVGAVAPSNGTYSFEEDGGWKYNETGTYSISEDEYYDGSKSLHVVRNSYNTLFEATSSSFLVEPGTRYRLGFYFKSQNSFGTSLTLKVTTYDDKGDKIRIIEGPTTRLNADSLSSSWSELFLELQTKNNAAKAKLTIVIKYGPADVYFDKAYCIKTGSDVFDETFSFPNSSLGFQNWKLDNAKASEDGLLIEEGGKAITTWNRFLSGYGYTFTFDAKGEKESRGNIKFEIFDTSNNLIQTVEKGFDVTTTLEQKSIEVTIKHGIKAYITFSSSSSLFIDNIHAVKSYSPNDESGWLGQWVTYPDADITNDAAYQNRWYRQTFELSEKVASASLQVTADDVRFPYLNGYGFGRGGTWSSPNIIDVTDKLVEGTNVFACRVYNGTYYSGLLFEITIITESGRTISVYSGKDTLTAKGIDLNEQYLTNEDLSWTKVDYDDSSWHKVYIVGPVGSMPWGSIPFISLATTVPEFELTNAVFPKEVKLGESMKLSLTWKIKERIEKPFSLSVSFWEKYSSDNDESSPIKSTLRQTSGEDMLSWEVDTPITIEYEVDIPDYMEEGSYMIQFDEEQIKLVNNPDFSNNKLRGYYVRFLPTEIKLEKTEIVNERGVTKLRIGKEDYAPYLFMQSDGLKYFKPVYATKMYESGVKLLSVGNNKVVDTITGISTWTNDNEYNFEPFDNTIYTTLSGAPKAKLLVMISCDPPAWWLNKYPEERALSAKGGTDSVSYASKRWVKDISRYMRAVLEHMKSMPYAAHIFAVKFAQGATYEWQEYGMELGNCADFSKVAQNGFREFLKEKYKTNEALQLAWGNTLVNFDNATIPGYGERESLTYDSLLDGIKQRNVLDYQDFKGKNVTDSILAFSNVVKEVSDGKWLAGTYQGYITNALTYEGSGIGNNQFARLLEKDSNCDFFCGPISYMTRISGYSNSYMQAVTSITNAGKLCLTEFDERTVNVDMPDQSPSQMDEWGKTYTLEDTINLIKRDAGNVLITGAGSWIYDMTGGWYHDEEIYNCLSILMKEYEYALKYMDNTNNHDVAFIIEDKMPSDYAYNFGASYSALEVNLSRQKEDLAHIGAGYDTYLASDLKKGLAKDYKVFLIVGNRFDKETIDGINNICKKSGTAIIWCGTPGIYGQDGSMSASNVSSLVDMQVEFAPGAVTTAVAIDSVSNDPLIEGIEGYYYGKSEIKEVNPVAYVKDSNATSLGKISDTDYTGLAYKEVETKDGGSYLSIFSSIGHLPSHVIRNVMKKLGCHIYDTSYSDVVFSSNGYLCIDSPYGGERTISLPGKYDVYDVFNDKLIGQDISSFEVSFDAKTSYLYRLMPANTYGLDPTPPVDPDNPIDPTPDNPIVPNDKSSNLLFPIIGTSIAGIEIVSMVAILIVTLKIKKAK